MGSYCLAPLPCRSAARVAPPVKNLMSTPLSSSRRDFLQKSLLGTAGLSLLGPSLLANAASGPARLVVLHTNDMHSRIEPFPDNAPQWAGLGGHGAPGSTHR